MEFSRISAKLPYSQKAPDNCKLSLTAAVKVDGLINHDRYLRKNVYSNLNKFNWLILIPGPESQLLLVVDFFLFLLKKLECDSLFETTDNFRLV